MDDHRFDAWTRGLFGMASRRTAAKALASGALAALLARLGVEEAAAFCFKEGKACGRGNQCCSGVCEGGVCHRAPHQGSCTTEFEVCRGRLKRCRDVPQGFCFVTTAGASLCGGGSSGNCGFCNTDKDCERVLGRGYYCVACSRCRDKPTPRYATRCVKGL